MRKREGERKREKGGKERATAGSRKQEAGISVESLAPKRENPFKRAQGSCAWRPWQRSLLHLARERRPGSISVSTFNYMCF